MEEMRPNSEQLLRRLKYEEEQKQTTRGKLKIFLGYAAGSGKTYTMLEAAHEAKKHGIDVVAGYIEPHDRPDTLKLTEGLEMIPPLWIEYKGVKFREFDLEQALKRKPKLILVDELAHTNVAGCRNHKRYQDVKELLRAGIDVYTTINIQHLESLNDLVGTITHIEVRERVPDRIFDHADQVEVIDIEPEDLIKRMQEGKIYQKQAQRALDHFFRREKLAALREITLRRTADRVNRIAEEERNIMGDMEYHTGEHVLVCISAAESSPKVIRSAARLAYAFHAKFTGIYVETPEMQEAGEKTKQSLQNHMELARSLGAKIVTVFGSDIGFQIAEYAVVGNVSKVVLGRTNHNRFIQKPRPELLEKLNNRAPNIDVYVIPDIKQKKIRTRMNIRSERWEKKWKRIFWGFAAITVVMILTTMVAFVLQKWNLPESNIIMVYILGVLLSSYISDNKLFAVYSSMFSVLAFNFFFTEPYLSLKAYDKGYPTTFLMLFIVGLFTAVQTRKLKLQNRESVKKAYRTEILLENSQKLRRCKSELEVWNQVAGQVGKLLNLSLIIYPVNEKGLLNDALVFPKKGVTKEQLEFLLDSQERAVAQWSAANHHRAGTCTHTLPTAKAMYIPIQNEKEVKGILGIYLEERRKLQEFEYGLLIAMLNETGVKLQDTFH